MGEEERKEEGIQTVLKAERPWTNTHVRTEAILEWRKTVSERKMQVKVEADKLHHTGFYPKVNGNQLKSFEWGTK
jgi:hypothetical protein